MWRVFLFFLFLLWAANWISVIFNPLPWTDSKTSWAGIYRSELLRTSLTNLFSIMAIGSVLRAMQGVVWDGAFWDYALSVSARARGRLGRGILLSLLCLDMFCSKSQTHVRRWWLGARQSECQDPGVCDKDRRHQPQKYAPNLIASIMVVIPTVHTHLVDEMVAGEGALIFANIHRQII